MKRLTEKTQIFRDYGEEYAVKGSINCRQTCSIKAYRCEDCVINNSLIKLGNIEDRQVNLKERLTEKNADFGYIVRSMDGDCAYNSCMDICDFNHGDCHNCDIFKAIQKLGEYEDVKEGNE